MNKSENFQQSQKKFLDNIRCENQNLKMVNNVMPERMQLYKELVYNNIESTVHKTFPVITKILNKQQWHKLVQDFIATQELHSPYFQDISKDFVAYLENLNATKMPYPFLAELAHYEWIELDVELDQSETLTENIHRNNVDDAVLQVSPTTRILTYDYPVHKISVDNCMVEKPEQPTFLVVYRTLDFEVKFMAINMLTACMLEHIRDHPDTLSNTLHNLTKLLNIPLNDELRLNSKTICAKFISHNILIYS